MNEILKTILLTLGGTTIMCGAVAWLIRRLTSHLLNKDIEQFKSDLKLEAFQNETKFRRLHANRAKAIVLLHNTLQNFYFALENYTAEFEGEADLSKDEKFEVVRESHQKNAKSFLNSRIFLTEEMDKTLYSIIEEMQSAARDYKRNLGEGNAVVLGEITDRVREKIKPILSELRADFRQSLGVKDGEKV